MGDSTAAGGRRAQGAGVVHPASWGSQRGGGRVGGRQKPDVKVTIAGDRSPRLGADVVTFEDTPVCANFLLVTWSMGSRRMSPMKMERQGVHEEARAGIFGNTNDGC